MPRARAVGGVVSAERETSVARTRSIGVALALLALFPAFAAYYLFTTWLPTDAARYADYRIATFCAATPPAPSEDCLRTVSLTVDSWERKGKTTASLKTTSDSPSRTYETDLGRRPLVRTLHEGDLITGTAWRGQLMSVSKGSLHQQTSDEPRDEPQVPAALGTFAAYLAALALAHGTLRLARPHTRPRLAGPPYTKRLTIAVAIAAAGTAFLATRMYVPWQLVPPLTALLTAATGYLIINWDSETPAFPSNTPAQASHAPTRPTRT